ncbi:G-protein coupled estrogen receptor 1 isoform X2 [Chiroxiphia lanceolata]|uniref:G-protein coupled estrogen receptor 1 isoform X2 n=1 Tax=Chiroxiphia lanceolata TaxID=296741 RepID=UPI0013CECAEE|nr:G-protein coupled estrogen receptor 1 isoform X2 [Chiroxiphia lanceolata]
MTSHNMTWISYPSKNLAFTSPEEIEDIIASQNIISRLMHCYIAFFVPSGLIAGICILVVLIKNYVQHKVIENLDLLLLHFTISNIIMILLSFTVITRPDYLTATHLTCNVLSFFFNFSYFNSQYVFILMLLIVLLKRFPPRTALCKATQRPTLCVGIVLTYTFCLSLTEAVLVGTDNYHLETDCQLDPLFAWPEYEVVKFTFGFGIPLFLQILCFTVLLAKAAPAEAPALQQHIRTHPALYVISVTMFMCRLFYNLMLLFRTTLKFQKSTGTTKNELVMNIAEIVLFCESCASLVFILCLHKPCKDEILKVIQNCRRKTTANNHHEIPETNVPHESGSQ